VTDFILLDENWLKVRKVVDIYVKWVILIVYRTLVINKLVGEKMYESNKNKIKKKEKIYERRRWKYLNFKPYLLI